MVVFCFIEKFTSRDVVFHILKSAPAFFYTTVKLQYAKKLERFRLLFQARSEVNSSSLVKGYTPSVCFFNFCEPLFNGE